MFTKGSRRTGRRPRLRAPVIAIGASLAVAVPQPAMAAVPAPVAFPASAVNALPSARPVAVSPSTPLRPGSSGDSVRILQRRLIEQGYWLGRVSGSYGLTTQQAVMAVQKVVGLPRTGVLDARTWQKLQAGARPRPRTKRAGRVIEISRSKQILMIVDSGRISTIVNTSTGRTPRATTPAGTWRFGRQIDRWHTAPLGRLYRPKFFFRGYAVHGSLSIPGYPASHGCARVSVPAMDLLWSRSGIRRGDRVVIY